MDCRGLIGPTRQFGSGSLYHGHLWALLVGAFLPIPFWWWQRRFPDTRLKFINIPVFLSGPTYIPPATGINYSSWFLVGYIFREYHPCLLPWTYDQRPAQSITFSSVISGGGPNSTTSSAQRSTWGRCFPSSLFSSPFRYPRATRSPPRSAGGGILRHLRVGSFKPALSATLTLTGVDSSGWDEATARDDKTRAG
jgi:hypothetical protein